ncbi:hypothetical protein [Verrucomicrobium sp. BvORR034]|uniref:hypothetical protein n=1 Tax=Verrucomicrobium sp. BvORR034 TaxID=1396418 RepID=UPI00067922D2|nr:hypothetical protein [Verrucomicrobium sp. BvORR034]
MKYYLQDESEPIAYVISGKGQGASMKAARGAKGYSGRKFICGPIPLLWMCKAVSLPKCGIVVALLISYCRGLERSDRFKLRPARLREFGIGRSSGSRGILALEEAGLIRVVDRHRGRAPLIEVLNWESSFTAELSASSGPIENIQVY